jgi:uncharacterized membrane protein YraQ (UPF0718 family)
MDVKILIFIGIIILLIFLPEGTISRVWSSENLQVFVILLFAVPVSFWIDEKLGKNFVKKINKKKLAIAQASIVGIATPGPIYVMFPITGELKKKRVHPSILVSFLTGQTSIGPIRLMMEAGIFGIPFVFARVVAAFLVSIVAGVLTVPLDKKL